MLDSIQAAEMQTADLLVLTACEMGSNMDNLLIFILAAAFFRQPFRQGLFFRLFAALLSTMVVAGPANAAEAIDCVRLADGGFPTTSFAKAIRYYEDPSLKLSLDDLQRAPDSAWKPLRDSIPSFGFSQSAYWLKFTLCSSREMHENGVLEITYPLIDHIRVIGVADAQVVYEEESGDSLSYQQRPVKHRNFVFFLPETQEHSLTLFLRVATTSAMQIPMNLFTAEGFFRHNQLVLLLQGLYFGIILAMVLYNGFLFLFLRELPYLLYILFTVSYFSFQGVFQGLFQQFLFDSVWLQNHSLLFFGFIAITFANWFAVSFLNLTASNLRIARILMAIGWTSCLAALLASIFPYAIMVKLMLGLAIPSSLLIMAAGFKLWWSGHYPARIFTIAWSTLLVSFVLASFNKVGLVPRIFWTENIMQIGGLLEVILLSIALAERVNEEKRQRILAEQLLTTSLEEQVEERTRELHQALTQLAAANTVLSEISHTDSLTQIANRRSFDIQLALHFKNASREGKPLALVMIDIDHFKNFNDAYGHQVGDEVLRAVAKTLKSLAVRPGDSTFRYGGEEFAILLNNTTRAGALIVAGRMRRAIEETPVLVQNKAFFVTISAGLCIYEPEVQPRLILSPQDLLYQADQQLYQAKQKGRNRIEPWSEDESV